MKQKPEPLPPPPLYSSISMLTIRSIKEIVDPLKRAQNYFCGDGVGWPPSSYVRGDYGSQSSPLRCGLDGTSRLLRS
jgi:hypothetical protein